MRAGQQLYLAPFVPVVARAWLRDASSVWWAFTADGAFGGARALGSLVANVPDPGRVWPLLASTVAWLIPLAWSALTLRRWPARVVGAWEIRSGADAVLSVWALGAVTWALVGAFAPPWANAAQLVVTLVAVIALHQETARADRWSPVPLFAGLAVGLVALAMGSLGFAEADGVAHRRRPAPFAGSSTVVVTLEAEEDAAARDAPAMESRLADLQVDGAVRVIDARGTWSWSCARWATTGPWWRSWSTRGY